MKKNTKLSKSTSKVVGGAKSAKKAGTASEKKASDAKSEKKPSIIKAKSSAASKPSKIAPSPLHTKSVNQDPSAIDEKSGANLLSSDQAASEHDQSQQIEGPSIDVPLLQPDQKGDELSVEAPAEEAKQFATEKNSEDSQGPTGQQVPENADELVEAPPTAQQFFEPSSLLNPAESQKSEAASKDEPKLPQSPAKDVTSKADVVVEPDENFAHSISDAHVSMSEAPLLAHRKRSSGDDTAAKTALPLSAVDVNGLIQEDIGFFDAADVVQEKAVAKMEAIDEQSELNLSAAPLTARDLHQVNMLSKNDLDLHVNDRPSNLSEDSEFKSEAPNDKMAAVVRKQYLAKFRKEVDFHHKVAFRFEKAYRLSKQDRDRDKLEVVNQQIIQIITEHSDFIEQDPMSLFYCLFFCIFYNNPQIVEFLQQLILKMKSLDDSQKLNNLMEMIETNGCERIRNIDEAINAQVYHMVLYEAFDDDLRIIYAQIIKRLKFIQLRDLDSLHLLKQRDYSLIEITFEKFVTKVNGLLDKTAGLKCQKYRKYNQAYFEEICIDYNLEHRAALNYRERFFVNNDDLKLVMELYARKDYVQKFLLHLDPEQMTHDQFQDLFTICLRNDSYKVGMQIFLRFLSSSDFNSKVMELLIQSLGQSCKFYEIKLFLILEYFDKLSIPQMNELMETLIEALHRKEISQNPMLYQCNTIKIALLIYRISWFIEQRKIYSLITKCSIINDYIYKSVLSYLDKQQHISQLAKFMREPLFTLGVRTDSLDIMHEMGMEKFLKHPVIIEVLNLVYEGNYSVDTSVLALSQTFQQFFSMEVTGLRSITDRIISNIGSCGQHESARQVSLQFNIWKQCIQQREIDEMILTLFVSAIVIGFCIELNMEVSEIIAHQTSAFGHHFLNDASIYLEATADVQRAYCPQGLEHLKKLGGYLKQFRVLILVTLIGFVTGLTQKLFIINFKENARFPINQIILEAMLITVSAVEVYRAHQPLEEDSSFVSDHCIPLLDYQLSPDDIYKVDKAYQKLRSSEVATLFTFQNVICVLIGLHTINTIFMFKRTSMLGSIVIMLGYMVDELLKFFTTFILLVLTLFFAAIMLANQIKKEGADTGVGKLILNIFDAFNGKVDFNQFTKAVGDPFYVLMIVVLNLILIPFMVAMFINKFRNVWENLLAIRRMNIIKLKNALSFDPKLGAITNSFFPLSIIMLPFIIPLYLLQSERLSEMILKLQYAVMIGCYCMIAAGASVFLVPLIYLKMVANSIFIMMNSRQEQMLGKTVKVVYSVFLGPFVVILSLIVDVLALPNLLMRDESDFETKYSDTLVQLTDRQHTDFLSTYVRQLYTEQFRRRFANKSMTNEELMAMHQRIFQLVSNMHDLMCRGLKDYRQALENVSDYNVAKILQRQVMVLNKNGDIRQGRIYFNILWAVQFDIELFNYTEILLTLYKRGQITNQNLRIEAEMLKQKDSEPLKVMGNIINSGDAWVTSEDAAAHSIKLNRNHGDPANNYYINIVSRSFTDIEQTIREIQENKEANELRNQFEEVGKLQGIWKTTVDDMVHKQFDRIHKQGKN